MANALKCDRCGKLYEHYNGIRVVDKGKHYCSMSLYSENGWNSRDYDLCPECMTKLVEFIKGDKEELSISDPLPDKLFQPKWRR